MCDCQILQTIDCNSTIGFNYGANLLTQNGIIISCPSNCSIKFIHLETMLIEDHPVKLSSSVVQMSYFEKKNQILLACVFGEIYLYDLTTHQLNIIYKHPTQKMITAITFIDVDQYLFSVHESKGLFLANFHNDLIANIPTNYSNSWYLCTNNNLVYSGFATGHLSIYKIKNSQLYLLDTKQAHKLYTFVSCVTLFTIGNINYIATAGTDRTIKLWVLKHHKFKLLKQTKIPFNYEISCMIYLSKYRLLVTSHHRDDIMFWKTPTLNLLKSKYFDVKTVRNLFVLNDHTFAAADLNQPTIQILQVRSTN